MAQKEAQESMSCKYWEQDNKMGLGIQKGVQGHNLSNKNRSGYVSSEIPTGGGGGEELEDWIRAEERAQDRWVGCRRGTNVVIETVSHD